MVSSSGSLSRYKVILYLSLDYCALAKSATNKIYISLFYEISLGKVVFSVVNRLFDCVRLENNY